MYSKDVNYNRREEEYETLNARDKSSRKNEKKLKYENNGKKKSLT